MFYLQKYLTPSGERMFAVMLNFIQVKFVDDDKIKMKSNTYTV